MTPIQVIGIGLDGAVGLAPKLQQKIAAATMLVGSLRHLSYFPDHPAEQLILGDLAEAVGRIAAYLNQQPEAQIVVLVSGDPLFFGLGRLLLMSLPPTQITFHPHPSAIQLAFSRIKTPWQDAKLISAHGRSLDEFMQAVQQGTSKIAVLTDGTNSPGAIARLLVALNLSDTYQVWVCENLGGPDESIQSWSPGDPQQLAALLACNFAPLNVVVLIRQDEVNFPDLQTLPLFGIPDQLFLTFADRPGLMTKREVRVQILGNLALQPHQVVWDIGAGTGSVSIEIARLCPTSQVYAIEKTAAGVALIQQNCQRFQVSNVIPVSGAAPAGLAALPSPDRVFIGGSGDRLDAILTLTSSRLAANGLIVLALATLEHLNGALSWLHRHSIWEHRLLQVQFSRSVPVGPLTRFAPLNPVTLLTISSVQDPGIESICAKTTVE